MRLFTGGLRETVRQAAAVSAQVHIRYTGRRYTRVIALLDEHYDELWVGGKASYKLGGIIEDGGELVIYAPHLKGISTTHGRDDREVRLRAARARSARWWKAPTSCAPTCASPRTWRT